MNLFLVSFLKLHQCCTVLVIFKKSLRIKILVIVVFYGTLKRFGFEVIVLIKLIIQDVGSEALLLGSNIPAEENSFVIFIINPD